MTSQEEGNIFILKQKVIDKLIKNNNFEELKSLIEKLNENNKLLSKENLILKEYKKKTEEISNNLFNDFEKISVKYIEKDQQSKIITEKQININNQEDLYNIFSNIQNNIDKKQFENENNIIKSIETAISNFKCSFDKETFKKNNSREMFLAVKNFYRVLIESKELILDLQEKLINLKNKNEKLISKIKNKQIQNKQELSKKMREIVLKQILLNYLLKEERSLRYNFTRFVVATNIYHKKNIEKKKKLIDFYFSNILKNIENKNLYFKKKYFMRFYLSGIIRELSMTKKQKKELEKIREEQKMKSFEERKKNNELSQQDLIRRKYLKDLFYKKIQKKINLIHNNFTKLYYRGVLIKMKYGDKAREKLFPEFKIQEEKKEEIKKEEKKKEKEKKKVEEKKVEEKKVEEKKEEEKKEQGELNEKQKLSIARQKARDLRKKLKSEKEKEKEKIMPENMAKIETIDIENEMLEIKDEKPKLMREVKILQKPNEKEEVVKIDKELLDVMLKEEEINELKIAKIMSKYIYRRERLEMLYKKKIIIQWNYRAKLLRMKEVKVIKKKKKTKKKLLKTKSQNSHLEIIQEGVIYQSPIIENEQKDNLENPIILKGKVLNPLTKFPTESDIKSDEDENMSSEGEDDFDFIDLNKEIKKHSILRQFFIKKNQNLIKNYLFKWCKICNLKIVKSVEMAKKIFVLSLCELIGNKYTMTNYIFKRGFFTYLKKKKKNKNKK